MKWVSVRGKTMQTHKKYTGGFAGSVLWVCLTLGAAFADNAFSDNVHTHTPADHPPGQSLLDDTPGNAIGHQTVLTFAKEKQFGDLMMRQLRAENRVSPDLVLNEYLQSLGRQIATVAPQTSFQTTVFGIRSKEVNAFTFFGGYIGVHDGLLLNMANEQALVAVLAHEYSHITQRHLARMIENHRRMMPLTLAEMLAAMAIGTAGSPELGMHAIYAVLNMHFQKMLMFSREHEQEADRQALQILAKLDYDPRALPEVFQGFGKTARFSEKTPEYLQSHPLNESRIADAQNRATRFPKRTVTDSLLFHWAVARTRVANFEERLEDLMLQVQRELKGLDEQTSERKWAQAKYTQALVFAKNLQYAQAISILNELQRKYPSEWCIGLSLAEAEYLSGQKKEGLARLEQWLAKHPRLFPVGMLYSEYLIREKKPEQANAWLRKYDYEGGADVLAYYQLLAQTHRLLGDVPGVHRAQAEWHLLRGDVKAARLQVKLALSRIDKEKDGIDFYKMQSLKERIKRLEKLL